jgi:hypothetical protein
VEISSASMCKLLCGFKNQLHGVIEEISILAKDLGFEDVDLPSVRECLDSHSQPLTDMDLTELEQQCTYDEKEQIAAEGEGCVSKKILIKEPEQMFRYLETVK